MSERSVRVRIAGEKAFLTIKGNSSDDGLQRAEWEKEITLDEANQLIRFCEPGIIEKIRYIVPEKGGLQFEVDEFLG